MHKFAAAFFADKEMASDGSRVLKELGESGATVYASAVVIKEPNGKISILDRSDSGSHVTVIAALIGGLAGLPAGPLAVAMGAAGGGLIGFSAEVTDRKIASQFLNKILHELALDKAALVVDLDGAGLPFFDARMKGLGGTVIAQE